MQTNFVKVGDAFIIPNALVVVSDMIGETYKERAERFRKSRAHFHKTLGKSVGMDRCYVQVWCTTPGQSDSNWSHPNEWDQSVMGRAGLTQYLPLHLFEGRKEGDVVEFETAWGPVKVTLNQKAYRYSRFGNFEEVLDQLLENADM